MFIIEKRLPDSASWRVGESAFECFGESGSRHGEAWSCYSNLKSIFRTLNGKTSLLKDQFDKKEASDVMYYHYHHLLFKGLKKFGSTDNLVDSPTRRVGESFFEYEYLHEFQAKTGTARNVV
jgi:hypothetical protein